MGALVALLLTVQGFANEKVYLDALEQAETDRKAKLAATSGVRVTDVDMSDSFFAKRGQLLVDAMARGGATINAVCKSGFCGSDPVLIIDGFENLSPATADELATVRRLGLEGVARLACCARVHGPVKIDRNLQRVGNAGLSKVRNLVPETRMNMVLRNDPEIASARRLDRTSLAGLRDVLIIGNGIAGITVADELRKEGRFANITVLSAERAHFYNRMAINKIAEGKRELDDLMLQKPMWYRDNHINVRLGERAVAIDRIQRQVRLQNGESLRYDRLVLATGSRAAIPGVDFLARENCFVLRSAYDALAIRDCIRAVRARNCVIVGGGVIAVETAEGLCRAGIATALVSRSKGLMHRNIDSESSLMLQHYLQNLGIRIFNQSAIRSFVGYPVLNKIVLDNSMEVSADVVVAALGSEPDIELAFQAGLETNHGIIVNEAMQTSDPNIYAVGDVAERPGLGSGLWPFAVAQAKVAVASILGDEAAYVEPNAVMRLKSEGIDLRAFGSLVVRPGDEVFISPPFRGSWWRIVVSRGQIRGAVQVGPAGMDSPIWRAVESGADISTALEGLRNGQIEALDHLGNAG